MTKVTLLMIWQSKSKLYTSNFSQLRCLKNLDIKILALKILAWLSATLISCAMLFLLGMLIWRGGAALNLELFFGDAPPLSAMFGLVPVWDALWPACVGTFSLLILTMLLALGPGIGGGIYLARHASAKMQHTIGFALDLLAGVPSIVIGLFGFTLLLALRSSFPQAGPSLLLSAFCLALLVLPVLVVTTRNALQSLPPQLSLTGTALGLSPWAVTRRILLPSASRGILGGVLLAAGRTAEDTAVIMLTGAVANAGMPSGLTMRYEALPFTIFYQASEYRNAHELSQAFATALVLLILSIMLLVLATMFERKMDRQWRQG